MVTVLFPYPGFAFIGDPAAPLIVKEWVKGEPVKLKTGTNIFIVEIWNSSGVASQMSTTNLNDLQKKFGTRGLVIAAISDESPDHLKEFVQRQGTNVLFSIAADSNRVTSLAYLDPVAQKGIPYAFIVGTNGIVLWHGHALHGMTNAVEDIFENRYDLTRAAHLDMAAHNMNQYLEMARKNDRRVKAAGEAILAKRTNDFNLLCDLSFQIVTAPGIRQRDFPLAQKALDLAEKLATTNSTRVQIGRALIAFESGKHEEGIELARNAVKNATVPKEKNNAQAFLKVMEKRMTILKTKPANGKQTNALKSSVQSAASTNAVHTNSVLKSSAEKTNLQP